MRFGFLTFSQGVSKRNVLRIQSVKCTGSKVKSQTDPGLWFLHWNSCDKRLQSQQAHRKVAHSSRQDVLQYSEMKSVCLCIHHFSINRSILERVFNMCGHENNARVLDVLPILYASMFLA